jgi:hypothetical protein
MVIVGWFMRMVVALSPTQQQELDDIEAQIRSSSQERKRHEALASKYADTAFRLQTNQKGQDARRFYAMEDQERMISRYLKEEIEELERRKAELLNPTQ